MNRTDRKAAIEKIFAPLRIQEYHERPKQDELYFTLDSNEITYRHLNALSVLLGTDSIDFSGTDYDCLMNDPSAHYIATRPTFLSRLLWRS